MTDAATAERPWLGLTGALRPAAEFPRHTPAERRADAAVHALGLTLALVGCAALAVLTPPGAEWLRLVGLVSYAAGLLVMLACSALYNLAPDGARKRLFRRLDHAAIFLMIAGTYTPFTLVNIAGTRGATHQLRFQQKTAMLTWQHKSKADP